MRAGTAQNKKRGEPCGSPLRAYSLELRARSIHPTHAAAHSGCRVAAALLFFLDLGDEGFGREHEARDRGGVDERLLADLGRIDDAGFEHVDELLATGVETPGAALRLHVVEE